LAARFYLNEPGGRKILPIVTANIFHRTTDDIIGSIAVSSKETVFLNADRFGATSMEFDGQSLTHGSPSNWGLPSIYSGGAGFYFCQATFDIVATFTPFPP
jgi:hypothetical protein